MRSVEEFLEGFQEEEFEILVYLSQGWGGASMLEGYHEVTSYFPAMVDTRTGECITADGRIETLVKNEDYKEHAYLRFADNGIYRLLVRKCIQKDLGPEILPSMNNRYLMLKVVEENASCPELEAIREEYTKEIVIELCGTEFVLNRELKWFEGEAEVLGDACNVYLNLDGISEVTADKASARFEALMQNMEDLDRRIKDYCVENMLDSANEYKEDENDPDVTAEQFKENMRTPGEIEVSCDGEVSILYGDNDMFGGHDIQIELSAEDEIEDWDIVG